MNKEKKDKNIKKKQVKLENKKEEKDKKKYLLLLLLLLFLIVFVSSVTFGKDIYRVVSEQIVEVLNLRKPSAPVITGGSSDWAKERLIKVDKDSEAKDGLSYYEYCINEEESTKKCTWTKTETKNVKIVETGKYYVTFRAVDKEERRGYNSNTEVVYIDNNNPVIKDIKVRNVTSNTINVEVDAKDEHSGIESYSYSLDGKKYEEGKLNYTYLNLEANKEYTIYIKVLDKLGNNTVLSMTVKTSEVDTDNSCSINCDTNNDGKCDLNCDTDNDGKCNLNCDTDGDGICDKNCDTNKDGKCDKNCSEEEVEVIPQPSTSPTPTATPDSGNLEEDDDKEEEDLVVPEINLDKVPSEFLYGKKYDLPSYYKFGPSGGEIECLVDGLVETDTSSLSVGTHNIECIARGNNGINVRVSKQIEVMVSVGIDEGWDGWIRLNLYYPENSTNWEWRIGKDGEIRDGYDNTNWQAYTGPILVKLEDVDDVYIRYELNGEIYVVVPSGKVAVSIEPNKYTLNSNEKAKVEIYYDKDAETKEYRIGNGEWQEYTEPFEVGVNNIIEARAEKHEKVYDNEGNYVYTKKITGVDSVFISEYIINDNTGDDTEGGTGSGSGGAGGGSAENGTVSGGLTGNLQYTTITTSNGNKITTLVSGSRPSTYLIGPEITSSPSDEIVESVKVEVKPQEEAEKIYVSVNGNSYLEYANAIEITDNIQIKAYYVRKSDGKVSETSYYYVQNIKEGNNPYVRIDATPNNYLAETQEEVEVSISGSNYDTLEYSLDGVIYETYSSSFTLRNSSTVYAKGRNSYGTTVEKISIPTVIPSTEKEDLSISIYTSPSDSNNLINKTEVSILYDSKAKKKYYRLAGENNYKEYTGSFEIRENTTIYAYATGENASGSATKGIDFLTTGIMEPIITVTPSEAANMVKVSIQFDKNANNKYYQIDGLEKIYYTGEFEVYENSTIYAYNSNALGYEADSSYEIDNIVSLPKYLVIDKGKYYIIKLNYPTDASKKEYKWKLDGTWKEYSDNGILLIKPEYKDEFNLDGLDGIKVEDENGKEIVFKDHYYLIDVAFSELMENLFMRWDTVKPKAPEIVLNESKQPVKEVEVGVLYPSNIVKKYYKIVSDDGKDTGWIEYTESFKVTENNVVVYVKGETFNEVESEISSLKITNIDNESPEINIKGDFETKKQQVTVTVEVTDNMMMSEVKWASGEQTEDYFKSNGTSIPNNGTFTITENGKYTIYAVDQVGNKIVKVIEVNNVDKNAPDIIINVLTEEFGTSVEVSIDYGDSKTKEYKIGENGSYQEYTENLNISSYDVYNLANNDGSLTIYARGLDETGNQEEVSEDIYILDLDIPESPKIIASEGYPTLTKDGMVEKTASYIVYDTSRDDLMNYYRIDEGEWTLYTGPISIESGKIEAKSVKTGSGLTVTSEAEVKVPNDALSEKVYDNNLETTETIEANTTKNLTVQSNLAGSKIRFYTNNVPADDAYIKIYDREGNVLDTITVVSPVTVLEIPVGGYKIEISSGSSSLELKEITLRNETEIIDRSLVPVITIDNPEWTVEKIINIKYPEGNYIKEYSIDNGETWKEYESPFIIENNLTVQARLVKEDEVLAGSTFTIMMIDTEMPEIALTIPSGIQLGLAYNLPTSYKVGASGGSAECKVDGTVVTNTKELGVGSHKVECTARSKAGKVATVTKTIKVVDISEYQGESILEILERDDIVEGKYNLQANGEIYSVHVYVYDEDQVWTTNKTFGDASDVGTASTDATRMVIVKVNGDVTVDSGVKVQPYYNNYGGPKGFTLYVTGTLTNNGTIDNSHGAKAVGQNVYLWKNTDGTYEYVPANGGAGGGNRSGSNKAQEGIAGAPGTSRRTGGGGGGCSKDI